MKFTNLEVRNVKNQNRNNVIIGIFFAILGLAILLWGSIKEDSVYEQALDMNTIIENSNDPEEQPTYINVQSKPYLFAVSDDTTDAYYIVSDDKYMYIAYLSKDTFNKLNVDSIESNPVRLQGVTKTITSDIKSLALDTLNEYRNDDNQIAASDFASYFGTIYLDTVNADTMPALQLIIGFVFILVGLLMTIIYLIKGIRFNLALKRLSTDEISLLDNEMNSKESFFYERAKLYLTPNYCINLDGTFKAIKYSDIIWMYSITQRVNFIKTSNSIMVATLTKKYNIASLDTLTRASKEIYEEIYKTILSKNDTMLVGYSNENIKKYKEITKENA